MTFGDRPGRRPEAHGNILSTIGNTPVCKLHRVCGDAKTHATVWGKCEYLNPGGSVKDRVALAMIEAAEAEGRITPGKTTLVEPTSGNTGIGLSLVAAVKGYKLILTMPESMSLERRSLLKAYGAQIILTPDDRTMEGAVDRARALCEQPDHVMLMQFENPANPQKHRDSTGPELLEQLGDVGIDAFVSAIGTGGTITGVGETLKRVNPNVKIIGVEPSRSPVLAGGDPGPHKIQGIGAGFIPPVLNRDVIDEVVPVRDEDAYKMKQRLATEEGLLVGISAGAAAVAARKVAEELGPGKNVVTVLCDTGERYFSLDAYFTEDGDLDPSLG
ncbi:MAG: cysteine synthase A [Nannocystaceae bacterium]|nr:cysteine synthase A [bacterium]